MENKIKLRGVIFSITEPHDKEDYYEALIYVQRASGKYDYLPVRYLEFMFNKPLKINDFIEVEGKINTENIINENTNKLKLNVYACATSITLIESSKSKDFINEVAFEGYICREPKLRVTPTGKDICDVTLANNVIAGDKIKSYYIPCILFGSKAESISKKSVSYRVSVKGRFQSRMYVKNINGEAKNMTALEVAVYDYTCLN